MSRWERTGERDLAFSQWHRENFGDDADAFDIDLVGVCHSTYCRTPLYKIEATRAETKATSMLRGDCAVSKTPGVLVQYSVDAFDVIHGKAFMVWPDQYPIGDLDDLRFYLTDLRENHDRLFHLARPTVVR